MKIEFATTFDSTTYPSLVDENKQAVFGVLRVGPIGLLTLLELHLGLVGKYESELTRAEKYRQCLKRAAEKGEPFYKTSFQNNDISVARILLKWRDELVFSGWDFEVNDSTPKRLIDLVNVEQEEVIPPGIADRFKKALHKVNERVAFPVNEVVIFEPLHLIPSFYVKLFDVMKANGVNIIQAETPTAQYKECDLGRFQKCLFERINGNKQAKIKVTGDGSISLLKFKDDVFAANYFSRLIGDNPTYNPLIVSEGNNYLLGDLLKRNGSPAFQLSANTKGNPIISLFKLITVLLWEPTDPYRLLELLAIADSPLPKYLSNKLAEVVSAKPGIGSSSWNEVLKRNFIENDRYEGPYRDQIIETLELWFNSDKFNATSGAPKGSVIELYEHLRSWAMRKSRKDEHYNSLYKILAESCSELIKILSEGDELLTALKLEQLIKSINYSSLTGACQAEAGSLSVISNASNILSKVEDLLWWNFTESLNPLFKDTWSQEEIIFLESKGAKLYFADQRAALWNSQLIKPLMQTSNRLALVIPTRIGGEETSPHPLLSNLEALIENLSEVTHAIEFPDDNCGMGFNTLYKTTIQPTELPKSEAYLKIDHNKLIQPREKESFSSLNKLFFYPYQWVLNYQAKIRPASLLSISEGNQLLGTFGHRIIEVLFNNPEVINWSVVQVENEIDQLIAELLPKEGSVLLIKGNETQKIAFINTLKRATIKLLDHIRDNNWEIFGTEHNLSGEIAKTPLESRIDLILKRGQEIAVVDLKWGGAKYKIAEIDNEEELQLVVYSKLAKPGSYAHTAYYILSDALMIARNKKAFNDAMVVGNDTDHLSVNNGIWARMEKTYNYRLKEVQDGMVEVGEGVDTCELNIYAEEENLLPLPEEKGIKSKSSFNDYSSLIEMK